MKLALTLLLFTYNLFLKYSHKEFDTDPMVTFSPVVEPNMPGAFITEHPRDEKTEKSFKIPFLTGVTYDEGLMKSLRKNI